MRHDTEWLQTTTRLFVCWSARIILSSSQLCHPPLKYVLLVGKSARQDIFVKEECHTWWVLIHSIVVVGFNLFQSEINLFEERERRIYVAQCFPALQQHVGDVDPDTVCVSAFVKANRDVITIIAQNKMRDWLTCILQDSRVCHQCTLPNINWMTHFLPW